MGKYSSFTLGLILVLALFLRVWNLAGNPPGLTWDEAALGYNAYSILQTGRDEYGAFLPLNLKSFGDWKPALYAYVDIPFVAIFGLNEWAVRLPSALFGVLGVFGVFLLVNLLFKNRWLSLSCAFFLAISPWHLQYSRPAFEANVALTFNIFAVYFFLRGLEKKKFFIPSSLLFGLSILTYQASKLIVPIFLISLFFIYCPKLRDLRIPAAIIMLFFLIIGWTFFSGQTSRLSTINFFAYQRSAEQTDLISKEDGLNIKSLEFQFLHGQWWDYARGLTERYLIYFSPRMLFIDGDPQQREKVPDIGALYYFSIVLIPVGLVFLRKRKDKANKLLLFWLLLSPIPAVLSRDLISTLRALNMVVPLAILEGAGLWSVLNWFKNYTKIWFYIGSVFCFIIIFSNFLIYLDRYYIHAPKEYPEYWLYGYKQAFENLGDLQKYSKVVITDTYGQPYIYYLFYTKYPPAKFQQQAKLDQPTVDVGTVRKIDNIEFRHVFWPGDRGTKNGLFIGSMDELPNQDVLPFKEFTVLKDINFLDNQPALRVVETKP